MVYSSYIAFIDLQTGLFFGTLCSLEPRELSNTLSNKLLHLQLYQIRSSLIPTAYGFTPDINTVLTKYELITCRDDYLN